MTTNADAGRRFPVWYLVYMAGVGVIVVALMIVAVEGIQTNNRQDAESAAANKARDAESARLLECFDEYAAASASTSKAVREASVVLADATTERDVSLDALFRYIATDPAEDSPVGVRLFSRLLASNAELVNAQAELAQVRVENPVPEAPSTFCAVPAD